MTRIVCGALAVVALAVVGQVAVPSAAPSSHTGPITATLAVTGRANANVSLATMGPFTAVVWSASAKDGTTDVFSAVSRDGGATFGSPVVVNRTPGDARVNGEQPPRVTLAAASSGLPTITAIWTAKRGAGTVLLTARSDDGGRTFGISTLVPGTDAPGNRGWEAIGADAAGRVHAVWLDHRRMAAPDATKTAAAHRHGEGGAAPSAAPKPDGVAMAQQSDLYFAALSDGAAPRAITAGVCYCCKTAIAFGPSNQIFLAWRHVYPGNFRDMAFAASRDGGRTFSTPVRVSQDNWMLEGCPDDGPAMKTDAHGRIHIVWPAVVADGGAQVKGLFHAVSLDGRTFGPRVRIPTHGQANHPQLAIAADGTVRVAWDESGSGARHIVTGRGVIDSRGRVTFSRTTVGDEVGVYPMVAATPAGAILAWTAGAPDASVIAVGRVQ